MFTTTPRLEEEFRFDIARQSVSGGHPTDNYGLSKGLELISTENTEIIFSLPPYVTHNSTAKDGFGDVSFLFKYRLLISNEEKSNDILTAFLGASVPTGMYKNGAPRAVITPNYRRRQGLGTHRFSEHARRWRFRGRSAHGRHADRGEHRRAVSRAEETLAGT